MENVIKSGKILVERKQFFFDLKENNRGRFLKITEDVNGRRDTIIIPAPGLGDFAKILQEMREFDDETAESNIPVEG
jgi:PurA ssDNA and RNA-binding protein